MFHRESLETLDRPHRLMLFGAVCAELGPFLRLSTKKTVRRLRLALVFQNG